MISHLGMNTHFGIQSFIAQMSHPAYRKYMEEHGDSDSSDADEAGDHRSDGKKKDTERRKRRNARLIGYHNSINGDKSEASKTIEKFSIALGICFVVGVTCVAVYLGYNQPSADNSSKSSAFKMKEISYDEPSTGAGGSVYNEDRLPGELTPIHYVLYFNPEMVGDAKAAATGLRYTGLVKIRMQAQINTSRIILHVGGKQHYQISKVCINTFFIFKYTSNF